jgi:hypothetical protein
MKKTSAPVALCLAALLLSGAAGKSPPPAPDPEKEQIRTIEEWEELHQQSLATDEGKKYEAAAVEAFWGDRKFMAYCVPEGAEAAALLIYFTVSPEGRLADIAAEPENPVANCIKSNIAGHSWPAPPEGKAFTGRIDFQF